LQQLTEEYAKRAAKKWDETLQESSKNLKKWYPNGVTVTIKPKAMGVYDTVFACLGSGIKLPAELMDETLQRDIEAASVEEWFRGYLGSHPNDQPSEIVTLRRCGS
jgi:hypothetical protein